MAIIFEEALKKNIKAEDFLPVYILFGEDSYLKSLYLNKISKAIAPEDDIFNYCKFEGRCDLQAVYDAAMQLPFMSDRKCVILNDYDFTAVKGEEFDRLLELIGEIPNETTLIMYFDGVDFDYKKDAKFKKLVSAAEKIGGCAVNLDHRSEAELVKMLCDGSLKRGCKMSSATAGYLVETSGNDINLLSNELSKLCFFVGEGEITKSHIDEVCTKTIEANLFKLTDYILACNSTAALNLLDELYFMRTEPMVILYTVSGFFVDMYRVYTAKLNGIEQSKILSAFSYPKNQGFKISKASNNLRKFDFNRLGLCLREIVNADKAIKSFGGNAQRIVEELIVKLIYIIAKGETID